MAQLNLGLQSIQQIVRNSITKNSKSWFKQANYKFACIGKEVGQFTFNVKKLIYYLLRRWHKLVYMYYNPNQ